MISVIIPVYNVEPYLRQCIDSIISQTYTDLEVLLIVDGSPDNCGEICEEYARKDKRIKAFHTKNNGLSSARNYGILHANGEYIGFLDSDDWIEPEMYSDLLERIEVTGADICMCGYRKEDDPSEYIFQPDEVIYNRTEALNALLKGKINNSVWNKLYRRELFREVRFPDGKNFEDVIILNELLWTAKRVAVISAPLYHYRVRQNSITKTHSAANLIDFADAHLNRYYFFQKEMKEIFRDKQTILLSYAAEGISKVWRWWYGCSQEDQMLFLARIIELEQFSKEHFPLFGYRSWPVFLQLSTLFMHSRNKASFAALYMLNQAYRKLCPTKGNKAPDDDKTEMGK